MHLDMKPFYPFSQENNILHFITINQLHDICIYTGIIGLFLVTATLVPLGMLLLSKLAQYIKVRPHNPSEIKEGMYECGMRVDSVRWQGYNLRYYYYALLFVVFDITKFEFIELSPNDL